MLNNITIWIFNMTEYEKKYDWKNQKRFNWEYKGKYPCNDPQYLKDREELFSKHGNGWWWGWQLVPPEKRPIDLWSGKKFKSVYNFKRRSNE